ncbi:hypothetical protein Avbf_10034 [Armadillidium vulgare]|nr:hypothetical protein Avbf_10034 [Armadillidium vulgare]
MAEASAAATSSILDSLEETILSDMGIAEVSNTSEERKSLLQAIEERVKPLRYSRGIETNNHFVQSFSFGIPVIRISVLCFEFFASFWTVKFL